MPDYVDKLNGTNFADWSIKMEALLEEKDLWEVISGEEDEPTTGPSSKSMKAYRRKECLARAKIILHVENSQLPHTRFNSPKEIWDNLTLVHRSRGLGTLLAIRRRFFFMKKEPNQTMQAWIAAVRHTAFQLEAADFEVRDLDLIIALTQGLPESYSSFTISLDSTPLKDLNVNFVIRRLLNEESRQQGVASPAPIKPDPDFHVEGSIMLARDAKHSLDVVCFNCRGKGHVA